MYKSKIRKLSNRNRILECIFRNAPIARTDIAEQTEITPATITANVTALISENIVQEAGEVSPEENLPGRKRILVDIVPDYAYSIGVEFTQKALVLCITNLKGVILTHAIINFTEELRQHITEEIISQLQLLIDSSNIPLEKFIGIGIAVPGHIDKEQNHMISNVNIWASFQPNLIRQAFPLPVVLENNVRCMALSEYLFRPNSSPDNFALFHIGLGMFCANIIDGELFLGNNYISGEIGHTIVSANGRRCECGKYGCLQTISSERWLLKSAKLLYENNPNTLLRNFVNQKEDITLEHLMTAYAMGDSVISNYISNALKHLGIMISNISIIMNPEKVFLHGQLFTSKDICNELMDFIKHQLLFVDGAYINTIEILPYSLTDGAVGASALAVLHCFIQANPSEEN